MNERAHTYEPSFASDEPWPATEAPWPHATWLSPWAFDSSEPASDEAAEDHGGRHLPVRH